MIRAKVPAAFVTTRPVMAVDGALAGNGNLLFGLAGVAPSHAGSHPAKRCHTCDGECLCYLFGRDLAGEGGVLPVEPRSFIGTCEYL